MSNNIKMDNVLVGLYFISFDQKLEFKIVINSIYKKGALIADMMKDSISSQCRRRR